MSSQKSEVVGILLAAGTGQRFGADKLLQSLTDGTTMACQAARNLITAIPNSIAVIRPDNIILREQLTAEGLEVITNFEYELGMGSSIACGVKARPAAKGWVIALGDMPYIKVQIITQVAEKINTGELIAAPRRNQQQGHPVGFSSAFRDDLLALNGSRGGRKILNDNINKVSWVNVTDSGIHYDIDEPAEMPTNADVP